MARPAHLSLLIDLLARAALPAMCLLVALYFGSHALFGDSGLLALEGIREERAAAAGRKAELAEHRARLEAQIALLDPAGANPDYADELVRRQLGVVRPDEIIVPLGPRPPGE